MKHVRMVKKTKNARWRIRQEEMWKKRQLAAVQERGDNKELDAVRRIVREEVKSGLDVAVQEAMLKALPELARTIVEEQEKMRKGWRKTSKESVSSELSDGSRRSLIADLKDLWA